MLARKISLLFYSRQDVCDQTLCVDEDDDDDIAYVIRNMIIELVFVHIWLSLCHLMNDMVIRKRSQYNKLRA